MATRTVSFRTDEETLKKIDALAAHEDRSRNWWINEVIRSVLAEEEAWQARIEKSLREIDEGCELIPHDTVMQEMRDKFGLDGN